MQIMPVVSQCETAGDCTGKDRESESWPSPVAESKVSGCVTESGAWMPRFFGGFIMAELKHDNHCVKAQREQANYDKKWPHYCQKCQGNGILTWRENMSPLGSGEYWPMDMAEPCDDCMKECPRCRSKDVEMDADENFVRCKNCKWEPRMGGRPEVECWCGIGYDDLEPLMEE